MAPAWRISSWPYAPMMARRALLLTSPSGGFPGYVWTPAPTGPMADVALKYTEVQPRPWDLITGAMSDTDGSPLTVRDPQWRTLLSSINGIESPPFPDFLSGHSAMGGTFASVMTHFFGDKLTFAATSEELPGVTRQFAGFKDQAGVKRISFYQAGLEDALSRIYGGRAHPRGLSGFL